MRTFKRLLLFSVLLGFFILPILFLLDEKPSETYKSLAELDQVPSDAWLNYKFYRSLLFDVQNSEEAYQDVLDALSKNGAEAAQKKLASIPKLTTIEVELNENCSVDETSTENRFYKCIPHFFENKSAIQKISANHLSLFRRLTDFENRGAALVDYHQLHDLLKAQEASAPLFLNEFD